MTLDTKRHIEAMQETAMALEAEARAVGQYSRDCAHVNDALTRGGKSGVALLWDAAGNLEVVSLNNGADHVQVTDEGEHVTIETNFEGWNTAPKETKEPHHIEGTLAYTQVNQESFKSMAAESHKRANETKGRFEPVNMAGDKARLAAELKAKQDRNTADAKRFNQEQYARNERIAAAMKERSAQIHK
jgi:hypothetical protein